MPKDFVLPELAESVVEGEIVSWSVEEGDQILPDQAVVEVMTDKVTVELPAPFGGVLVERVAQVGDVVRVGEVIARIETDAAAGRPEGSRGPGTPDERGRTADAAAGTVQDPDEVSRDHDEERDPRAGGGDGDELSLFKADVTPSGGPVIQVRRRQGGAVAAPNRPAPPAPAAERAPTRGAFGRVVAVPAARRLARELGVRIEDVAGSGPSGRVRVDDVRDHMAQPDAPRPSGDSDGAFPPPVRYRTPEGYEDREERVPLRGLRRVIAQQMTASHLHTVRTLHVDEADVGELVRLRERLKPKAEARGVRLTYLPFVMKAVVNALRDFPALNSSMDHERGEIVLKRYVNLGLAVSTDTGLVVPSIKDADRRSLLELAAEANRLAAAARDGALAADEVRGSTFSITNIGSIGGLFSFPIINVPEAAILGVHSIKKRPVVRDDDTIVARPMLYLSLSFDHRLVDGAEAARFTKAVIDVLETPEALLLDA